MAGFQPSVNRRSAKFIYFLIRALSQFSASTFSTVENTQTALASYYSSHATTRHLTLISTREKYVQAHLKTGIGSIVSKVFNNCVKPSARLQCSWLNATLLLQISHDYLRDKLKPQKPSYKTFHLFFLNPGKVCWAGMFLFSNFPFYIHAATDT